MIDLIMYSLRNVMNRKMRSWLTVLSILIGITAVYALISFGLGIQSYMDTLAEEAGADKIFIQAKGVGAPGTDENFFLTADDVDFVEKMRGVNDVTGMYFKVGEIVHKKENKYSYVMGFDASKTDFVEEIATVSVETGRNLKKGEVDKIVLGYNYQLDEEIFKRGLEVGSKVELNGKDFTAVGFYDLVGNPGDDANIYLTFEGMEQLYPDIKDKFGYIVVKADKGEDPEELAVKIEDKLRKFKDQEEGKEDFYVQSFADLLETFGVIINVLNGILVLIALISLVVASVNIMNTMYTAVLERTKEIGIMKAIGARNRSILFIFVFESGFLGLMGGVIGVLLGYFVASTGGAIAANAGYQMLKPIFPLYLTVGCLVFSFAIGAVSGVLPAIQASKQKPVDALRYE